MTILTTIIGRRRAATYVIVRERGTVRDVSIDRSAPLGRRSAYDWGDAPGVSHDQRLDLADALIRLVTGRRPPDEVLERFVLTVVASLSDDWELSLEHVTHSLARILAGMDGGAVAKDLRPWRT